jgi:hypothetical protein
VTVCSLIHRALTPILLTSVALAWMNVPAAASPSDDGPSAPSNASHSSSQPSDPVQTSQAPAIVIGFVGGFVRHDDAVHSTVILAHNLKRDFPVGVRVETFENRRTEDAHNLVLRVLGSDHQGHPTPEQKRAARVILYGHSWGASAAVTLARTLQADGVPVLLTVQVDSVAKGGQDDALIPTNVERAANFYQDQGFLHGQSKIHAADPQRTQILGNFRQDYSRNPISCPHYPWIARTFMRSHIEIECDSALWHRVEDLIRQQLPSTVAAQTTQAHDDQ